MVKYGLDFSAIISDIGLKITIISQLGFILGKSIILYCAEQSECAKTYHGCLRTGYMVAVSVSSVILTIRERT